MGFRTRTPREGYFKVQQAWLPVVDCLALNLGVDLQSREYHYTDRWDEYHNIPYHEDGENSYSRFWRNHARDRIDFQTPARIPHCELLQGETNVLGETAGFAFVEECDNRQSDKPADFNVEFNKGFTTKQTKSTTRTEGWSFQNEFKVGGSYGGVDFENTTTVGAHGEYERMKATENEDRDDLKTTVGIVVPARGYYKVEQYQNKAQVEVVNLERMSFDIAFDVWCHKKTWQNIPYLHDNKRMKRYHGTKHSYSILSIRSSDDLYELLIGVNADYPKQRSNLLKENAVIRKCWEFLSDTERWSIESEERIPFDNAQHGIIRIVNMQPISDEDLFIDPHKVAKSPEDAAKLKEVAIASSQK